MSAPRYGFSALTGGDIVAALCLVTFALAGLFLMRVGIDSLDEGYFVEQAMRVLHGQVPYRDFDTCTRQVCCMSMPR